MTVIRVKELPTAVIRISTVAASAAVRPQLWVTASVRDRVVAEIVVDRDEEPGAQGGHEPASECGPT